MSVITAMRKAIFHKTTLSFDIIMDVGTQSINSLVLMIYRMVIADFLLQNKLKRIQFFEISFLTFFNIDI